LGEKNGNSDLGRTKQRGSGRGQRCGERKRETVRIINRTGEQYLHCDKPIMTIGEGIPNTFTQGGQKRGRGGNARGGNNGEKVQQCMRRPMNGAL